MRSDYCDITIVLDRSGSMHSIQLDTIGGFNNFIEAQKKLPGKATLSLVQFDDHYEPNYMGSNIQEVKPLTTDSYIPRGTTALLDAVGKTIVSTGERLKAMAEDERPGKVIFVVITDGYENASHEYKKQQVKDIVSLQQNNYKWEFVYLGANVDAFAEAGSMGMSQTGAMNYTPDSFHTHQAYRSLTANTTSFRAGATASMAWTDEDRKAQDESK